MRNDSPLLHRCMQYAMYFGRHEPLRVAAELSQRMRALPPTDHAPVDGATLKQKMLQTYGDAKVANRDIRVWHGATEKGP
jgi:hypothetical protein